MGLRPVLRLQLTPGPISSLPRTPGLPLFISFSTSYRDWTLRRMAGFTAEWIVSRLPVTRPQEIQSCPNWIFQLANFCTWSLH
jgi:hypothetical protein